MRWRKGKKTTWALSRPLLKQVDVFFEQNGCSSDQDDIGCHQVEYQAKQFDHVVGLWPVDTRGSDFLPRIGDGIQSDNSGASAIMI